MNNKIKKCCKRIKKEIIPPNQFLYDASAVEILYNKLSELNEDDLRKVQELLSADTRIHSTTFCGENRRYCYDKTYIIIAHILNNKYNILVSEDLI